MIVAGLTCRTVWLIDVVCQHHAGDVSHTICMSAKNLVSGQFVREWLVNNEGESVCSPFHFDESTIVITHHSTPVVSCFLTLGWPLPVYLVDLYAEFRNISNGIYFGACSCADMLKFFGSSFIDAVVRLDMLQLIQRGGAYSGQEMAALQNYCDRNVAVTERLFECLKPHLDAERTLFRGEYMISVAKIEQQGVPVDAPALQSLQLNWDTVKRTLAEEQASLFPHIFKNGKYCQKGLFSWINQQGIPWPRTPSGLLQSDDDTLKDMAALYPELEPIRQVKKTLALFNSNRIPVGTYGRNRCNTGVFGSLTGRNQPLNAEWIFGAPKWMRGFIRPDVGGALALIDFQNQEFAIAAALSGDAAMIAAYQSGDPYMELAISSGAAPIGATKETHPGIRAIYKTAVISIFYGIGGEALGYRIGGDRSKAELMRSGFKEKYRQFCAWQNSVVDQAYQDGYISTSLGWKMAVTRHTGMLTVGNFLMQATGSDILRLAVCLAHDRGVKVCAMIHDAILVECDANELERTVNAAAGSMREATEQLLGGFPVFTDVQTVRFPERLIDNKHRRIWESVQMLG